MKTHRERAGIATRWIFGSDCKAATDAIVRETYPNELVEAAREFVRKVECGEARSERSYAAFKAALALYDKETE